MDPYLTARFLHILFATIWFGLTIGGGQKALWFAREDPSKEAPASDYLKRAAVIGTFTGLATIALGQWLMMQLGGWEEMPTLIHVGASLAIVIFVIGIWPIGNGWRKLAKEKELGTDLGMLEAIARRIGLWYRVVQLLWIAILATMVFRHF
ncbi:hypothetical protein [Roseibium sp. RKSG952]|uniref:hypothetical protein n=1 Tax=Roseibium sp. RKSG952 TaxID=2529384 RepID=UPI0012BBF4AD|nr:hypothetical protein [Roseibium sp. RKSG952]MTI02989.1 hypothetical protein [Roseibium sp. RKSG952]